MNKQSTAAAPDAGLNTLGTLVTPGVNQPFSVHGANRAWLVESGNLDLFLVGRGNGEPEGARHFVMRVESGRAVLAFPHTACEQTLVAVASPATTVREFSEEELHRAASASSAGPIRDLVERWVEQLSAAASTQTPPKVFGTLEPGKEFRVGYNAQSLMPREGVVWVRQTKGESLFLAHPDMPLDAGDWFPLSRYGWLESAPSSHLRVLDWPSLQLQDPHWSGLDRFQSVIFECLVRNRELAAEQERSRLKAKAEADAFQVEAAISLLATPLVEGAVLEAAAEVDAPDDPLLQAAQAVGQAQGVTIKPWEGMRRGLKVKDPVAALARASSLRTRRVVLRSNWWTADCGPVLAFRDRDNRPVALLPRTARSYEMYDPVERSTVRVTGAVAATLNGFAYVFYRPFPETKLGASDLLKFGLYGCRGDLRSLFLMGMGAGFLGMASPFITGIVFDTVIPGAQRDQLLQLGGILLACAVTTTLFTLTRSFAMLRLEGKLDASIQSAVWDRLLNLPVPFFRDYTAGDLAVRGMGINQMRQVLTGSTLNSILAGIFSVFSFALLFYYNVKLALLASGLTVIAFLVSLLCGYLQVGYQRDMSAVRGRISGSVLQFIAGIAKLRVAGAENRAFASWARNFTRQKDISNHARQIQNHLTVFNSVYPLICLICIFYYAAQLMGQQGPPPLTTGDFVAFNAAFTQFLAAALQLSASIVSVLAIVPLYERAKPIFHTLPEVAATRTDPGELVGAIDINHVVFRYRTGTPLVLRDLSLRIPPGQFIAFVGPSGSGKSTLFRMLLGFEKPESGSVYYDGQDLAGLDVHAVRRQIGVVLQNGKLFSGDVFTNIVGSAPLTIDDAWEAARMAGLDQDLKAMPMGMHTVVSEGGGGLSGGQRQRLMIARAIVNKPRILLFDEATSALDNETQATVSASLKGLQATRVVIAHRLSTILHADQIFVLDKGMIVQSGTYEELIEQGGLFAELSKRQLA